MRWLAITISLKVSAIFPPTPVQTPGRRTEKSPSRMVCKPARISPRSALVISAPPWSPFPEELLECFGGADDCAVVSPGSVRFMPAPLAYDSCFLDADSKKRGSFDKPGKCESRA